MTPRERVARAIARSVGNGARDPADNPPDSAEIAQILDAMRRLPRIQREILLAIRFGDCSYAAIAERLGRSVAQVQGLFVKALVNFGRNMGDPNRSRWRRWLG